MKLAYNSKSGYIQVKSNQGQLIGLKLSGTVYTPPKQTKFKNYVLMVSLDPESCEKLDKIYSELNAFYAEENINQELKPFYITSSLNVPTYFLYLSKDDLLKYNLEDPDFVIDVKFNVFFKSYDVSKYHPKLFLHSLTYERSDKGDAEAYQIDFI